MPDPPAPMALDERYLPILKSVLAMANIDVPGEEVPLGKLEEACTILRKRLGLPEPAPPPPAAAEPPAESGPSLGELTAMVQGDAAPASSMGDMKILLIGELGIVTYQLKVTLARLGGTVTIIKGVDEAIMEYNRRDYQGVVIDIFMPTEREGLLVLMEINRMKKDKGRNTQIVVLASASREKDDNLPDMCRQRGAALYVDKVEGWHQKIINTFLGTPAS